MANVLLAQSERSNNLKPLSYLTNNLISSKFFVFYLCKNLNKYKIAVHMYNSLHLNYVMDKPTLRYSLEVVCGFQRVLAKSWIVGMKMYSTLKGFMFL